MIRRDLCRTRAKLIMHRETALPPGSLYSHKKGVSLVHKPEINVVYVGVRLVRIKLAHKALIL